MTPQARYIKEARRDPVFRRHELDRQSERRRAKGPKGAAYRRRAAAYARAWRARKSSIEIKE